MFRTPDAQPDRWPVKVTIHTVDYSSMKLTATMEAYDVPSQPAQAHTRDPATAPPRTASITTYLEGEIIDFNSNTLLTESFKSSVENDADYWRKLTPFRDLSSADLARNLLSQHWLTTELCPNWILMRWKERCFVKSLNRTTADPHGETGRPSATSSAAPRSRISHAQGATAPYRRGVARHTGNDEEDFFDDGGGCGLTIYGFYYVALRRADGFLEGLYYDPQSTPYQYLAMNSVNGGSFPKWDFC